MSNILNILITLLVICFIVFFHELGHFLFAKLNKIKVIEFSIGFGHRLLSKKIGETRYSVKAIPLGGSCEMEGMIEEITDMQVELSDRSFVNKGKLARAAVIAAGPLFNFVLAFLLALLFISIRGYNLPFVKDITDNSKAVQAGLKAGDLIYSINGGRVHSSSAAVLKLRAADTDSPVSVVLVRKGEKLSLEIPALGDGDSYGIILSSARTNGDIFKNIEFAYYETIFYIDSTITSLRMMFTGRASLGDMVGPVGLTTVVGRAIRGSDGQIIPSSAIFSLMSLAALLSANLGIINLLPIPAFDGGRLLLIAIEAVRGRRLKPKTEEMIIVIGFLTLIGLSALVFLNDIFRFFR